MTEHPITPPHWLVQQWADACPPTNPYNREVCIATQAARWGADQELEACVEWLEQLQLQGGVLATLRAARRPKPPSLKQQALETLRQIPIDPEAGVSSVELDTIRRALEALPDD